MLAYEQIKPCTVKVSLNFFDATILQIVSAAAFIVLMPLIFLLVVESNCSEKIRAAITNVSIIKILANKDNSNRYRILLNKFV